MITAQQARNLCNYKNLRKFIFCEIMKEAKNGESGVLIKNLDIGPEDELYIELKDLGYEITILTESEGTKLVRGTWIYWGRQP